MPPIESTKNNKNYDLKIIKTPLYPFAGSVQSKNNREIVVTVQWQRGETRTAKGWHNRQFFDQKKRIWVHDPIRATFTNHF